MKKKKKISSLIVLQRTSPLRKFYDINNCVKIFKKRKAELVTSFCVAKPKSWYKEIKKSNNFEKFLSKQNQVSQTAKKKTIC